MSAAEERARRRRSWPIRRIDLEDERDREDLSDCTTVEERLGMMWELARSAWAVSNRPLPVYSRANAPGRIIRKRRAQ